MILALLFALASPQDGCAIIPENWSSDDPVPLQRTGDGLWIGGIAFVPADIVSAVANEAFYGGEWELQLQFSASGNAKFIAAQACGVGRIIEISIDRKVVSRPTLNEPVLAGAAQISGGWQDRATVEAVAKRITGGQ